jgi:hypothetical protein
MDLRGELIVNALARQAWTILCERFADIGEWAAPITASRRARKPRVGGARTCHTARFGPVPAGTIQERLIVYDPDAMSLTCEAIDGMPSFFERAINRWSMHPLDDERCLVRTHATVTLRGPIVLLGFLLKCRLQSDGARVLDELRHRVEHGRPHPRKVEAMPRLAGAR